MDYVEIIKCVLSGKKVYEYSDFCKSLKELIKENIKSIGYNPDESIIDFTNLGKGNYGKVVNVKDIYINYSIVRKLYNCENIIDNLHIIFHEISHIKQIYNMRTGKYDENTLRLIMETCIVSYEISENIRHKNPKEPTYYRDNYINSFIEADADMNGINKTLEFIISNGIEISQEEYDNLNFKMNYYKNKLKNSITSPRYVGSIPIFNCKYMLLDDAFNFLFEIRPQWEVMYPQLSQLQKETSQLNLETLVKKLTPPKNTGNK